MKDKEEIPIAVEGQNTLIEVTIDQEEQISLELKQDVVPISRMGTFWGGSTVVPQRCQKSALTSLTHLLLHVAPIEDTSQSHRSQLCRTTELLSLQLCTGYRVCASTSTCYCYEDELAKIAPPTSELQCCCCTVDLLPISFCSVLQYNIV